MASQSWSNPNPSDATAAALGNAAHIQPIDIGSIVGAIIKMREQEAARQQEQQQQTMQAVAKSVGSVEQGIQQGNANDAANATMYGIQYPNDPYGGFNDPNKVPDYGGTSALKMLESAKNMGGYASPLDQALKDEHLKLMQAQEYKDWNGGSTAGANGSASSPVVDQETGMIWNGRQWVKPNQEHDKWAQMTPIARGKLDSAGAFTNNYEGADSGDYVKLITPEGKEIVVPYDAYQSRAASKLKSSAGIRQDDVLQAAQAMGEDGKPIPGATSSSTTSNRPGAGPLDQAPSPVQTPSGANMDKSQALEWAKAHPDDPRAAKILQILGQ